MQCDGSLKKRRKNGLKRDTRPCTAHYIYIQLVCQHSICSLLFTGVVYVYGRYFSNGSSTFIYIFIGETLLSFPHSS